MVRSFGAINSRLKQQIPATERDCGGGATMWPWDGSVSAQLHPHRRPTTASGLSSHTLRSQVTMAFWSKNSGSGRGSTGSGSNGNGGDDFDAPVTTDRGTRRSQHPGQDRTSYQPTTSTFDRPATGPARAQTVDLGGGEWADEVLPPRDWKKLFLVIGLGVLSWVATYVGMLELIEANMGDLPIVHKLIIGFSVAMLMTMIVWLLDQLFAPIGFFTKVCYAGGYLFLTLISAGFGFGFYWKVLESRSEATRGAESAIGQVQGSLYAAATRLEQLNGTLVQLTAISTQKAELERASGTSCPNSKPGDGPRRKMREDDAARFTFASDFVKGRVGSVKSEMTALDADLAKILKDDKSTIDAKSGTRNDYMRSLSRKLDNTVTGFNAFRTDPQLKQIRADLAERADKTTVIDSKGVAISCPDMQLSTALKGVVRAIDQLPELEKPKVAAVEGSEATIEAFRRLTATFYGALSFKLPPSADELRDAQKRAVQSVESPSPVARAASMEQAGLSKRDYVPLAIAIFVDLCLLLVSMGRPVNRLGGMLPKMREAERGPVIQILSRFNDIHRDKQVRENFEIFRHVVFDFNGDYYVAVPLDAPRRMNPEQREDLRLEAQLLSNLFTSFEKEKIFNRVMMPLFSTGSVQKRLRRQGSKFAESEAFRIYKFKDGAWSEIILGAIMGAAKRVESEKRRRRVEDDVFTRHEPQFDAHTGASIGAPIVPGSREEQAMVDRALANAFSQPSGQASTQPSFADVRLATAARTAAERGWSDGRRDQPASQQPAYPYAPNVVPHPNHAVGAARLAENPRATTNWSQPVPPVAADPAPVTFGQGGVTSWYANNNTAPAMEPSFQAPPMPSATVQVTATERTVSYSVPVSEAVLPQSVHGLIGQRHDSRATVPRADEPAVLLPSPDPTADNDQSALDPIERSAAVTAPELPTWNERTVEVDASAIAKKFGPVTGRA